MFYLVFFYSNVWEDNDCLVYKLIFWKLYLRLKLLVIKKKINFINGYDIYRYKKYILLE